MKFYTLTLSAFAIAAPLISVAEELEAPAYAANITTAANSGDPAVCANSVMDEMISSPKDANPIIEFVCANNLCGFDAIAAAANDRLTAESAGEVLGQLQSCMEAVEPAAGPEETNTTGSPA